MYIIFGKKKHIPDPVILFHLEELPERVILGNSKNYSRLWGIKLVGNRGVFMHRLNFTKSPTGVGSAHSGTLDIDRRGIAFK